MRGFFRLSRPVNVLISMLSVLTAILICGVFAFEWRILFACLTSALLTAAANAVNDYFDHDIDLINRPNRPLPHGDIEPTEALYFALSLFILGVFFSYLINIETLICAGTFSLLLICYSARWKRMVLIGNIVVSLATAFAFLYGGFAVKAIEKALFPALFAFLMHFGREIIKDMEDIVGDQQNGAVTFPIRYGNRAAKIMVTAFYVILMAITYLPYVLGLYGRVYVMIVSLGVNTVLLWSIISLWHDASRRNLRLMSAVIKADMFIGLAAIYAGRWQRI
jgi:geranylgeranylglycerol-phosphate geranylgeranyltransferase